MKYFGIEALKRRAACDLWYADADCMKVDECDCGFGTKQVQQLAIDHLEALGIKPLMTREAIFDDEFLALMRMQPSIATLAAFSATMKRIDAGEASA